MKKLLSLFLSIAFAASFAASGMAQSPSLPTPFFGKATIKADVMPSIMLNSATSGTSINSVFGQKQGQTQWRLGLGGSTGFFQVERYNGGVSVDNPFVINNATGEATVTGRNFQILDQGRTGNENNPAMSITSDEALNYTGSFVTNYGLLINRHMLSGGTGDRIGLGVYQTCDATLAGKSCVGGADVAIAGGTGLGNYTGKNSIVKIPPGLTGPAGAAVAHEFDTHVHSPVGIVNGIRIASENIYGAPTVTGSIEDAAIAIVTSSVHATNNENLGYTVGIQFGEAPQGYPQNWPIRAGGTLIHASEPTKVLNYGLDFTGMTAGWTYGALAMPINKANNGIVWGYNAAGGRILSTAATTGPRMTFTDSGLFLNNASSVLMQGVYNDGRIQAPLQTPASSSAACVTGQFMNDANFHYVCVATNTWKRAALAAF